MWGPVPIARHLEQLRLRLSSIRQVKQSTAGEVRQLAQQLEVLRAWHVFRGIGDGERRRAWLDRLPTTVCARDRDEILSHAVYRKIPLIASRGGLLEGQRH